MPQTTRHPIIPADLSHAEFLSEFGGQSFIAAYSRTLAMPDLLLYTEQVFSKDRIVDEISTATAHYFICLDSDSQPCGYSKVIQSPPPACVGAGSPIELQRLYVAESHQRLGLGGLLMRHAESQAQGMGCQHLWLRVWEENQIARNLYVKANFSIVGDEGYRVGDESRTVLVMQKDLLA